MNTRKDPHERMIEQLEKADQEGRGTGRTTKMLYRSLMSDAKYVTIYGPTQQITRHLHKLFREYAPHPDSIRGDLIVIANKQYRFETLYSGCYQQLIGIMNLDVFFDHTVYEHPYIQSFTFKEIATINEIQKRCDAWRDSR